MAGASLFDPKSCKKSRVVPPAGEERRLPKYDLAIIGSGPGGYVTAIRAAQWGLKTVVIEKDGFLGGTCLHIGCIPTKVLLHHAEIYDYFKNAKEFGIEVKDFKLDWTAVLARKDKIIKKHAKGIEFLFRKNKVESMQGDRKSTRLNSSHLGISYAVFCLKK